MLKTMKVAGIEGDCQIKDYENTIVVHKVEFGVRGTAHIPGITATEDRAGKAHCERVRVIKSPDKASALLFKACVKGDTVGEIKITYSTHAAADNGARTKVMEITLKHAKVAGWDQETVPGLAADGPFDGEFVSFSFKEMRVESFSVNGAATGAANVNLVKGEVT